MSTKVTDPTRTFILIPKGYFGRGAKDLAVAPTDSGCWKVVSHCTSGNGYPNLSQRGKVTNASRVVYQWFLGPINDKELIRHSCDNPLCLNPQHLLKGSNADNARDKAERGRSTRGELNWTAKLTEKDIRSIRQDSRICREIALDYGVSRSTISSIKCRRTWGWLT